ncbi:17220_t:CDS:2 [Acaulospora morrowiae]|uniref:17220_t:CDS:1 n=1 Tax=Acaulospora morrowiae TaxID=94023 RepID=A0A9N8Z2R4_9GLOM|nr:17220_t:CDS:2 [Acaulospora morrowiae]
MTSSSHTTTKNWSDRIHSLTGAISKANTKVGDLPSILLDTFFPKDSVSSTFSHIVTHCVYKGLVEREVVDKELIQSELDLIYQTLSNYCKEGNNNRSHYIECLAELCDRFYKKHTKQNDSTSLQFVVVMAFFSLLHLTVLREREFYQEEIFASKKPRDAKDLSSYSQTYKAYFKAAGQKWKAWQDKIRTTTYAQGIVPGNFYDCLLLERDLGKCEKEKRITSFFNDVDAEFTKLYTYTSALEKFFPKNLGSLKNSQDPIRNSSATILDSLKFDPYGAAGEELSNDKPGVIAGIDINYSSVIDAIRIHYREPDGSIRKGTQRGNSDSGNLCTIRGLNKEYNHVVAVDLYCNKYVVYGLRFFFSDGTSTQTFGEEVGERKRYGSIEKKNLKLTGIRTAGSLYEPLGKTMVISRIELSFGQIKSTNDNENLESINRTNSKGEKEIKILGKGAKSRHLS